MNIKRIVIPVLIAVMALALSLMQSTSGSSAQPSPLNARARIASAETLSQNAVLSSYNPARQLGSGPLPPSIEVIGQVGGSIDTVAYRNALAYISIGPRVVVLNVASPTQPAFLGQSDPLPNLISDIALAGNYAYVASRESGLHVFDVAAPAAMAMIGAYDTPGVAFDITVSGRYAYVADGEAGLRILDIGNPAAPFEVGFYQTAGRAMNVAVSGGYAYVAAADTMAGLQIVNISNPAAPVFVGVYFVPGHVCCYDSSVGASDVALVGNYAYLAAFEDDLRIIDVTNPALPVEVGFYLVDGYSIATKINVSGDYAYLADRIAGSIRVINVSNSISPTLVSSYSSPVRDMSVQGNYAYLATGDDLKIVTTQNPLWLQQVGVYASFPSHVADVARAGNYVYALDDDMYVYDVTDPSTPLKRGSFDMPWPASQLVVSGTYGFLAEDHGSTGALRVINVSDPASVDWVGFYPLGTAATGLAVEGNYAYLSLRWPEALRVVDVSSLTLPTGRGLFAPRSIASGEAVAVSGNHAYLAFGSDGLRITDVSDPDKIIQVGSYGGSVSDVTALGDFAYVGMGMSGLHIINVINPLSPTLVGSYSAPEGAYRLTLSNSFVYAIGGSVLTADGFTAGRMRIINVTNPTAPTEDTFYDSPGVIARIVVADKYAYVADRDGGFLVLRLAPWLLAPTTGAIVPDGGQMTSSLDQTTYVFPSGVFTSTVIVTHTIMNPRFMPSHEPLLGVNHFFEVTAVYSNTGQPVQLTQPYTLTVQYTDQEKGPAIESTLALYSWDGNQWAKEPSSVVDVASNTVTAAPNHFSVWAVLGETHRLYLPVIRKSL